MAAPTVVHMYHNDHVQIRPNSIVIADVQNTRRPPTITTVPSQPKGPQYKECIMVLRGQTDNPPIMKQENVHQRYEDPLEALVCAEDGSYRSDEILGCETSI